MPEDIDVDAVAEAAREEFDLEEFLQEIPVRTKTITVYTDEVTGEKLGGLETYTERNALGLEVPKIRKWGVKGKLVTLEGEIQRLSELATPDDAQKKELRAKKAERKKLETEALELEAKLEASALEIELRSLAPELVKTARRKARTTLGIKGKNGTPEQEEKFPDENNAQLIHRSILAVTRKATGHVNKGISLEGARALQNRLPSSEFLKIITTIGHLSFESAIATQATEDPDF